MEWRDKRILAEFEGVYKNCVITLNGREIGSHKYGYTSFTIELTGLKSGTDNTLTVVADNSKLPNSRWYSGSGIYRPVWLYVGDESCIEYRGVKITTLSINPAKVRVETRSSAEPVVEILDGEEVVVSGKGAVCELEVPGAKLWSDEAPNLYVCRVTVGNDVVRENFGIREIKWSPKGLFINGKETLLRGGCVHHDNGILGAAAYDESEWRRVRIMKEAGFNALRMAHNPCSRAMLEACDYYGMYVMDETFDMWYNRKTKFDYGNDFEDCWKEDTAEMVERDYNHPSVIMYSIGNEVAEPFEAKGVDAGRAMVDLIHGMDTSRPVTCGLNLMIISRAAKGQGIYKDGEQSTAASGKEQKEGGNASLAFNIIASFVGSGMNKGGNSPKVDAIVTPIINALDIAGYNYGSGRYPLEEKQHPERIIFGSETFPQDICKNWAMVKKYPITAELSDDYTEVNGIYSQHYTNLLPPYTREAPTYFEKDDRRYLFTSGTSGYYPNKSQVCVFDDFHGEYQDLGNPHIGDDSNTSFSSQITCILKVPGKDLYIACADRWMPGKMAVKMSAQVITGMEKHFKNYKPDTSPREASPLPGKELKHSEKTCKSTYVWLPIEWQGEKPVIKWHDEWRIEDYK